MQREAMNNGTSCFGTTFLNGQTIVSVRL